MGGEREGERGRERGGEGTHKVCAPRVIRRGPSWAANLQALGTHSEATVAVWHAFSCWIYGREFVR
jgi:hypothetical protein